MSYAWWSLYLFTQQSLIYNDKEYMYCLAMQYDAMGCNANGGQPTLSYIGSMT